MRITCVDASAINGGPPSRAIEVAARAAEDAGGRVTRLRLYDLYASKCSACGKCANTRRCSTRDDRVLDFLRCCAASDSLVVGLPAVMRSANEVSEALLDRMVKAYAEGTAEAPPRATSMPRPGTRVVAIVACSALLEAAVRTGNMTGAPGALKRAVSRAGVSECRFVPVARRLVTPQQRDALVTRASAVGASLAIAEPPGLALASSTWAFRTRRADRHRTRRLVVAPPGA